MQIATYTRSESGTLARLVETWNSLSEAVSYYFNLQSVDDIAPRETSENLLGWPEKRVKWVGKIGLSVSAVQL
jgi:hypothetical protein